MVKLDVSFLKYLPKEDFRVLTAIEMGHKNHELVPTRLINTISNLKFGGCHKSLVSLHKHKLIYHENKVYDGFRLTYAGYDYLVLKTFSKRGTLAGLGNQIGTGKESDIYIAINDKQEQMALKLQRLGRVSFRTIKRNRDYLGHRKSASWLYLSRLAALKEYSYMKALHDSGFPVPRPIDLNRHCVLMQLIPGTTLNNVRVLLNPGKIYSVLMSIIVKFAQHGLIHGDFNEFNIMIDDDENIIVIDFPQMVSVDHINAEMYFDRDVNCIRTFFEKRYGYVGKTWPKLHVDTVRTHSLDKLVAASGFTKELQTDFDKLTKEQEEEEAKEADEKDEYDTDEGDDKEEEEVDVEGEEKEFKHNKDEEKEKNNINELDDLEEDQEEKGVKEVDKEGEEEEKKNLNKDEHLEEEEDKEEKGVKEEEKKKHNKDEPQERKNNNVIEKEAEDVEEEEIFIQQSEHYNDEEEEGGKKQSKQQQLDEIKKRQQIQKRVKKQLQQKQKRQKGLKNTYKQRDKRNVNAETKAWISAMN